MTKVTFTPADPDEWSVYNGYEADGTEFSVAAGESVDVSAETAARLKEDHPEAFGGKKAPASAKAEKDEG